MKRIMGVDVDLTVVSTDYGWIEWFLKKCNADDKLKFLSNYDIEKKLPYNLGSLFPSVNNSMEYWNELDYSQFLPIQGSVDKLTKLNENFNIVFVSHIEGSSRHGRTKANWLKKHFPFYSGIVYTREKSSIEKAFDYFIDDRNSHLIGFPLHKRIRFATNYTQDVKCEVFKEIKHWDELDIGELLK